MRGSTFQIYLPIFLLTSGHRILLQEHKHLRDRDGEFRHVWKRLFVLFLLEDKVIKIPENRYVHRDTDQFE